MVDDTDYVREILELMLDQKGYKVYSFANPEDALAVAETIRIDIFVVDMVMPNLDGLEVLRRLNVKQRPYEAIMITGDSNNEDAAEALRLGAYGILKKPFTFSEFATFIEYALASASAKKQQVAHLMDSSGNTSVASPHP